MAKSKFPIIPVAILSALAAGVGAFVIFRNGNGNGDPTPENPVLMIQNDIGSGKVPLTVNFSAAGSGGTPPYSFAWTFGDGESGVGDFISHTYNVPGTYKAECTLMDQEGRTKIQSVTINVLKEDDPVPDPIGFGDVTVVLITENNFQFVGNLSNLRSDIDAVGSLIFELHEGTDTGDSSIIDTKIVPVTIPASGGINEVYTIPSGLAPGPYTLSAVYEEQGSGIDIATDIRQFVIEGGTECPPGFHMENGQCVPDDPGGNDPVFGDATVTIDQLQETIFRTSMKNEIVDEWEATLTQRVLDSNSNEVFIKVDNFTMNEFQLKQVSAFIPTLPAGNYQFISEIVHRPNGLLIGSSTLNFVVGGGGALAATLEIITHNEINVGNTSIVHLISSGGVMRITNIGTLPIKPNISARNLEVGSCGVHEHFPEENANIGTINPGQSKDVAFFLEASSVCVPANVTVEIRLIEGLQQLDITSYFYTVGPNGELF